MSGYCARTSSGEIGLSVLSPAISEANKSFCSPTRPALSSSRSISFLIASTAFDGMSFLRCTASWSFKSAVISWSIVSSRCLTSAASIGSTVGARPGVVTFTSPSVVGTVLTVFFPGSCFSTVSIADEYRSFLSTMRCISSAEIPSVSVAMPSIRARCCAIVARTSSEIFACFTIVPIVPTDVYAITSSAIRAKAL